MKKKSLSFLIFCFHFFCFSLFLIEVYLCLDSYYNQGVGTNSLKRRQEFYNRPEICLSAYKFLHDGFNDSLDIEYDDYIKGKWKIKNMSEESLFESIAQKLHDLIQARLWIFKRFERFIFKKVERFSSSFKTWPLERTNITIPIFSLQNKTRTTL